MTQTGSTPVERTGTQETGSVGESAPYPWQIAQQERSVLQEKKKTHIAGVQGMSVQAVSLDVLMVNERLRDVQRPERPSEITTEHTCQVVTLACEQPKERPISRRCGTRNRRRRDATRDRARAIGPSCRARVKKDLQPHRIRSWLTPPVDLRREETMGAMRTGERTGVPLAPGNVERRECEYLRSHGPSRGRL